jgi:hypothetical protein
MITRNDLNVENVAYHRNGCCGDPFYVVTFVHGNNRMVAVQFDGKPMATAVFNLDQLAEGVIAFAENSYRGDWYAGPVAEAVSEYESFREIMG